MLKNILITGGSGLVGTGIVTELAKSGHHLFILDKTINKKLPGLKWVQHDLRESFPDLVKIFHDIDILIHNAAWVMHGTDNEEISEIQKINIDFSKRLFDWAATTNVKKIVLTSGISVISKPLPEIIFENSAVNPVTFYLKSKLIGEQYLQETAIKNDILYYILRLSSPVSFELNQMPMTVVKKWIINGLQGNDIKILGNGSRTQDFVAVSDIAQAFLSCINCDVSSGIFNIASGNVLSMLDLAKIIAGKFKVDFFFENEDINEDDRWNISIKKAQNDLGYFPSYTSETCILELLKNIAS